MNKNKNFNIENKYTFADAFKCFFFLLIVTAGLSLVLQIIIGIIASIQGVNYDELAKSETVSLIGFVISPIIMIVYYVVFNRIKKVSNKFAMSDGQKISLLPISISMVLAIISIFLFTPFMNLIDFGFFQLGYLADNTIPMQSMISGSIGGFMLGILIYALLPAISEELIFRGIIQKSLSAKLNGFATIFLTTVLFALMHGALQQTVYQIVVGIMLSYVSYVGGSILYSIILHFLNNAFVLLFGCFDIVSYLSAKNTIYYNIFSVIFPFMLFLLGCVLVAILFWVLKYLRNKNFFRYDPKQKKKVKFDPIDLNEPNKIGLRGLWKNSTYIEKIFMLCSFVLVGLIWIINTISGFF